MSQLIMSVLGGGLIVVLLSNLSFAIVLRSPKLKGKVVAFLSKGNQESLVSRKGLIYNPNKHTLDQKSKKVA